LVSIYKLQLDSFRKLRSFASLAFCFNFIAILNMGEAFFFRNALFISLLVMAKHPAKLLYN